MIFLISQSYTAAKNTPSAVAALVTGTSPQHKMELTGGQKSPRPLPAVPRAVSPVDGVRALCWGTLGLLLPAACSSTKTPFLRFFQFLWDSSNLKQQAGGGLQAEVSPSCVHPPGPTSGGSMGTRPSVLEAGGGGTG